MKNRIPVLCLILIFNLHIYATVRYVKYNSSGLNNGTSWTDAYTSLQSALTAAGSGDQIWVAAGTYKPTTQVGGTGARYAAFQMKAGVAIYGGFSGLESSLTERNISANVTILSGDIGTEGDNTDNCYHVFNNPTSLTSTAILDGFTITAGNANGGYPEYHGGGVWNSSTSPTISNCKFLSNSASACGGGMSNMYSSPTLVNCTFSSNSSSTQGGGMYNYGWGNTPPNACTTTLINCTFSANTSVYGGAMYNEYAYPTLNNCIIWGNVATYGHEFYIKQAGYTTTLNYSCYGNGDGDITLASSGTLTATNNNITSDPQFVGSTINPNHPYSIIGTSPCADAGDNTYITEIYDIRGSSYSRKLNKADGSAGTVDMGAYEYKYSVDALPVELTSFTGSANEENVTLRWQTATEVNNYGFNVECRINEEDWKKIGFVHGYGNSNSPKEYSFTDHNIQIGKLQYRLKQIDFDGGFEYSNIIEIIVAAPQQFKLAQNFPNPFNPTTIIQYQIPNHSSVSLRLFDVLGKEITTLVIGEQPAGNYSITLDGSRFTSGIYYYQLRAGEYKQTRKLILMK